MKLIIISATIFLLTLVTIAFYIETKTTRSIKIGGVCYGGQVENPCICVGIKTEKAIDRDPRFPIHSVPYNCYGIHF